MYIRYRVVRYKHTNDGMEDNGDKVGLLPQVTLNQSIKILAYLESYIQNFLSSPLMLWLPAYSHMVIDWNCDTHV